MESIRSLVERMGPKEALVELAGVVQDLFARTGEQEKLDFIMQVTGETDGDKVSSMVNL